MALINQKGKANTNWLRLSMRRKGITPIKNIAHPTTGKMKIAVLLMNLKLLPRVRRVYMSKKLWWLDTYTAGVFGEGKFSNPSISTFKNGVTVASAQILAII